VQSKAEQMIQLTLKHTCTAQATLCPPSTSAYISVQSLSHQCNGSPPWPVPQGNARTVPRAAQVTPDANNEADDSKTCI